MADITFTSRAVAELLQTNVASHPWNTMLIDVRGATAGADANPLWSGALLASTGDLRLDPASFVRIVDDVPLYRHAIELEIDKALFRLVQNDTLTHAQLEEKLSLQKGALRPRIAAARDMQNIDGSLYHLFLEHLDTATLIRLAHAMEVSSDTSAQFRSLSMLIGRHPDPLVAKADGWMFDDAIGAAVLGMVLPRARRAVSMDGVSIEDSVAEGRAAAAALHSDDPSFHVAAWRDLDLIQCAVCTDLDTIFRLCPFGNLPPFARADMFTLMKLEAMKQVHASALPTTDVLPSAIAQAMDVHRTGLLDPAIEKLVAQFLSYAGSYAGQAGHFVTEASRRARAGE